MVFKLMMISMMAIPGKTTNHHCCISLPEAIILPQVTVSTGSPIPKNEMVDSAKIAPETLKQIKTTKVGMILGKTWLISILTSEKPNILAVVI